MDAATPPKPGEVTDRNLALELVRVTEAAAIAASPLDRPGQEERGRRRRGGGHAQGVRHGRDRRHRGDRRGRDGRGADAVYRREGRRRRPADGHRGRSAGGHHADLQGRPRARSPSSRWPSMAISCTRPTSTWTRSRSAAGCRDGVVDLDAPVGENLRNLARAKQCDVSDLVACILDRDRHKEMIAKTREAGARIMLISDGDVAGVIATATPDSGDRHLPRLGRRAGGRAGGGGAALHRRPDAGPADVTRTTSRSSAPATMGHRRSAAQVHADGDGEGRRDVRRHRRHHRRRCCAA